MNNSLPDRLSAAIAQEMLPLPHPALAEASIKLSSRYREGGEKIHQLMTPADRCAYLAVRLPATYAVIRRVLLETKAGLPPIEMHSLLDIGAGPGTAMWGAAELFPSISSITLLEQDPQWIAMGKRLAFCAEKPAIKNASWIQQDAGSDTVLPAHDLVMLSYMIGEILDSKLPTLVSHAWQASSQVIVFIEPGTPKGFSKILTARNILISLGANIVAPCPHHLECPLAKIGDWCHFAERLERSELHRAVKDVSMGYEDEKYSYVAASKFPTVHPQGRIVRHPQKRSGHISFTLCTAEGEIQQEVISKKQGEAYKQARKLEWGESKEQPQRGCEKS